MPGKKNVNFIDHLVSEDGQQEREMGADLQ